MLFSDSTLAGHEVINPICLLFLELALYFFLPFPPLPCLPSRYHHHHYQNETEEDAQKELPEIRMTGLTHPAALTVLEVTPAVTELAPPSFRVVECSSVALVAPTHTATLLASFQLTRSTLAGAGFEEGVIRTEPALKRTGTGEALWHRAWQTLAVHEKSSIGAGRAVTTVCTGEAVGQQTLLADF